MPQKPSAIKCSKCGLEPNIITDVCLTCGTKLEKVCGSCGFANAVEKNYCDQCGQVMALKAPSKHESGHTKIDSGRHNPPPPPPGAPGAPAAPAAPAAPKAPEKPRFQLEMQPIEATISEKDISFRRLYPGKPPAAPEVPGAGALNAPIIPSSPPPQGPWNVADRTSRPVSRPASRPQAKPAGKPLSPPSGRLNMASFKKIGGALITLALIGVLGFILYMIAAPHLPKFTLEMTAKNYLKKLSAGRFDEAYSLLSSNSKLACTMEAYVNNNKQVYSKVPAWEFNGVEVVVIEKEAAMVKYQLREGTSPWRAEYISFIREHDRWTRPYVWQLFEPLEAALAKPDYPQALFLAQKLSFTDPLDPRAAGYLCASEYFMGLYDKAAESCRRTSDAFITYPGRFPPAQMFWFRVYYADSLRYTQKYEDALAEYDELIKYPGLLSKDLCPLYMNRADALVRLKKYDSAFYDMQKADGLCLDANGAEAQKKTRILNGTAMKEAVELVQKTPLKPGQPPFAEQRKKELAAVAEMLGSKNMKFMPIERWVTAHIAGPEYRLVLKQDGINPRSKQREIKDIYAFVVNLWTGAIRLEKDPSLLE